MGVCRIDYGRDYEDAAECYLCAGKAGKRVMSRRFERLKRSVQQTTG